MTIKRIVGLSVVGLIVLAIAGAGVALYINANSGPKLLARINLALKAGNLDKALNLAETYARKYPDNWRGYYYQARARSRQSNYALARPLLDKAASLNATEPSIILADAETYSLPASQALSPAVADPNTRTILGVVEDLTQAVRILSAFKPADDKAAIGVNEAIGLDYRTLSVAKSKLSARLEAEAQIAEAAKNDNLSKEKKEAGAKARSEADDYRRQAIRTLLDVIREDPARDTAAEPLVMLCLRIDDRQSLEAARKAVDAAKIPPPMGAMLLAVSDLIGPADRTGTNFAMKVDQAAKRLDVLLAAYPDNNRIRQKRAELAMEMDDVATAGRLVTQMLESEPRSSVVRLLLARVNMAEGNYVQADRELYALTAEFPNYIQAHYYYAVAADATGKIQLARDQMRAVTRIDPGDSRETIIYRCGAHKYFARGLLAAFPSKAFDDAREACRIDPNDPEAMLLMVESANRSDRSELARKTLEDALNRPGIKPRMLVAAADGYLAVGDHEKADEALQLAAKGRPEGYADRLAVAQALIRTKRGSQADQLLNDAIREDPNNPQAHYVMALRYDSTGRGLQAREHYRNAMQFNSRSPQYRLALANFLVKTGELDEALAVIQPALAASDLARQCELQIKILQGPSAELDAALQGQGLPTSGLPLAIACLQSGQAPQCVKICQAELETNPASFDYRVLLARALLMQNKLDESVELWARLIADQPAQLPLYNFLALAMARQAGPQAGSGELFNRISAVPSARPDLANAAVAELCHLSGRHAEAAGFYDKVAQDPNCNDAIRYKARLLQARSLANDNQPDQALAVLDKLVAEKVELKNTLANKINLLAGMRRLPQAEAAADELFRLALADHDVEYLSRLAGNFAVIGNEKKALAACDAIQALEPKEADAYVLRANVLERFGKLDQAGPAYDKAIGLNPTELSNYVRLAGNLDARRKTVEAMDTLRKLEGLGQAARLLALYTEAKLFVRWGLRDQARDRLKAVDEADFQAASPAMQLDMARAMAAIDLRDAARAILLRIPQNAAQYPPATQLLADLAETTEKKLAILHALADKYPGNDALLAHEMKILMDDGKPAQAVKAFDDFLASGQAKGRLPTMSAVGAFTAAIKAGNLTSAMRTAKMLADSTGPGTWTLLAAALAVDCDPDEAASLLPGCDQSQPATAMLGLCLARKAGDANAARRWLAKFDEARWAIDAPAVTDAQAGQYNMLCAMLVGDDSRMKSALDKLKASRAAPPDAPIELAENYLANAAGGSDGKAKAVAEAGKLLRIEIALSLLQPDLARLWSREVLKARPTCLWAAARLVQTAGEPDSLDPNRLDEVAALIQPPDCYLAQRIRALVLNARGQYDQAAKAYESIIAAKKPAADLLCEQAGAVERAGYLQTNAKERDVFLKRALAIYKQAIPADGNSIAANNAAYVMSRLFPKDPEKLAEARMLSEKAMNGSPNLAFRETAGWIAYLQGRTDDACRLLRQAVTGMPPSAEVHYHLGMAENAAGNPKLARMHLAQAAAIADKLRADKTNLKSPETEAGDLAKTALVDIEPD
jgi:tetratricopeptide (TPR) repeat protein